MLIIHDVALSTLVGNVVDERSLITITVTIGAHHMARPLIQMALDSLDFNQTVALADQVAPYVDIFEIGTPCIKYNGINL